MFWRFYPYYHVSDMCEKCNFWKCLLHTCCLEAFFSSLPIFFFLGVIILAFNDSYASVYCSWFVPLTFECFPDRGKSSRFQCMWNTCQENSKQESRQHGNFSKLIKSIFLSYEGLPIAGCGYARSKYLYCVDVISNVYAPFHCHYWFILFWLSGYSYVFQVHFGPAFFQLQDS